MNQAAYLMPYEQRSIQKSKTVMKNTFMLLVIYSGLSILEIIILNIDERNLMDQGMISVQLYYSIQLTLVVLVCLLLFLLFIRLYKTDYTKIEANLYFNRHVELDYLPSDYESSFNLLGAVIRTTNYIRYLYTLIISITGIQSIIAISCLSEHMNILNKDQLIEIIIFSTIDLLVFLFISFSYILMKCKEQQQLEFKNCKEILFTSNIQESCSICLQDYQQNDQIIVLPCFSKHYFHPNCIRLWFEMNAQCPICKAKINLIQ